MPWAIPNYRLNARAALGPHRFTLPRFLRDGLHVGPLHGPHFQVQEGKPLLTRNPVPSRWKHVGASRCQRKSGCRNGRNVPSSPHLQEGETGRPHQYLRQGRQAPDDRVPKPPPTSSTGQNPLCSENRPGTTGPPMTRGPVQQPGDVRSSELNSKRCQIRCYREPIEVKELGFVLRESMRPKCVRGETRITSQPSIFVAVSVVPLEQPEEKGKKKQEEARQRPLITKGPPLRDSETSIHTRIDSRSSAVSLT